MSPKRKVFVKTDLSIPAVIYQVTEGKVVVLPGQIPPEITSVIFPPEVRRRAFDFSRWYGVGIDAITFACQRQIERFLAKQDTELSATTVASCCTLGLLYFLDYLTLLSSATNHKLDLNSIDRELIDGFICSLDASGTSGVTRKNRYQATKTVLQALARRGLIHEVKGASDNATFPTNPFPGSHKTCKGEKPFPKAQRQALVRALNDAIQPFFSNSEEPTAHLLSFALLIVALHTGRNTTPLLEMEPDCLRSHPKDNLSFLVLFKRRAKSTSKVVIHDVRAAPQQIADLPTIKPTVAKIVRRVLDIATRLKKDAPPHLKNRVWLFRKRSPGRGTSSVGQVQALNEGTLAKGIATLVERYKLEDTDGKPLRLNISRLRKTFVNRIFEISDGNVAIAAAAAGDTVQVTGVNYLRPGESAMKNWKFLGLALTKELVTNTLGASERTPVGRCSDVEHGDYAPKKEGLVCTNFLSCLRCRNYVVTGDDLYRLFSFYWRVLAERSRMRPQQWKRQLGHIVRLIDRDVIDVGLAKGIFQRTTVDAERDRAKTDPHPFWRADSIFQDISEISI